MFIIPQSRKGLQESSASLPYINSLSHRGRVHFLGKETAFNIDVIYSDHFIVLGDVRLLLKVAGVSSTANLDEKMYTLMWPGWSLATC